MNMVDSFSVITFSPVSTNFGKEYRMFASHGSPIAIRFFDPSGLIDFKALGFILPIYQYFECFISSSRIFIEPFYIKPMKYLKKSAKVSNADSSKNLFAYFVSINI